VRLQRAAGVRPHAPAAVLIDSANVIRCTRFKTTLNEVYTESAKRTKAELKAHVPEMPGSIEMHYHAIGLDPACSWRTRRPH
jgi:hypothetical protein